MRFFIAAALTASAVLTGTAAADPLTPFPAGGQYVTAPGTSIDFTMTDGTDTYFLQYLNPLLQYVPATLTDLDADGMDDYLVAFTLTAVSCFTVNAGTPDCGPATFSTFDAGFIAPGPASVRGDGVSAGEIDTEMVALSLMGSDVIGTSFMRESPTLASLGETTLADSFFDIFFEIAPSGPNNFWLPQQGDAVHFTLETPAEVPEPGSLLLFATGVIGIGHLTRRRRQQRRLPTAEIERTINGAQISIDGGYATNPRG